MRYVRHGALRLASFLILILLWQLREEKKRGALAPTRSGRCVFSRSSDSFTPQKRYPAKEIHLPRKRDTPQKRFIYSAKGTPRDRDSFTPQEMEVFMNLAQGTPPPVLGRSPFSCRGTIGTGLTKLSSLPLATKLSSTPPNAEWMTKRF